LTKTISRRKLFKDIGVIGAAGFLGAGATSLAEGMSHEPSGSSVADDEISRVAQTPVEDWVADNGKLRIRLRPDALTLTVEDLVGKETWSSDPWENSAGSIHLRGKHGESASLALSSASQKKIVALQGNDASGELGFQLSLSEFRPRMMPGREDRDPGSHLSIVLKALMVKNTSELVFQVQELHNESRYWTVESVEWPLRLFSVQSIKEDGYIVMPQEQGLLIPSRFDQGYFRNLNWIWERIAGWGRVSSSCSMPWFGAKKGDSSFICIVETPDDAAYGLIANDVRPPEPPAANGSLRENEASFSPRLSTIWPVWNSVKGQLGYMRVARYIFQPHGGYVEMCKTYRQYAQKIGKFVTLKQKIAANPNVAKLIGAPNFEMMIVSNHPFEPQYQGQSSALYDGYHAIQTSFDELTAIIHDMKDSLGMERAAIRIAGWGQMGYDNYRPIDELPVNKEAGGPEKLAAAIQAAKSAGFLAGLFDNYRNLDLISPSYDEKYIMRNAESALVPGFSSEGGRSEEICPKAAVELIKHNVAYIKQALDPNMHYLDTIAGLPLVECYDPRHPMTRSECKEERIDIMKVVTGANLVLGAEAPPQDWNLGQCSYYDEHPNNSTGIDVPLYGLVYHECAMLYRQHGTPYDHGNDEYGFVREPWPTKFLRGLLYGDESSWTFSNKDYWAWKDTLKSINSVMTPHQRRLAFEELLSHKFLTPDFNVQRTVFSSGVEVTVNYGQFTFKLEDGTELPAHGYRIEDKTKGHSSTGAVQIKIMVGTK
jgi:hypothetical protein